MVKTKRIGRAAIKVVPAQPEQPTVPEPQPITFVIAGADAIDLAQLLSDAISVGAPVAFAAEREERSPNDLMVMRRTQYDALFEDAAAIAAYGRTRGEESVPATVVDRLIAGEHPVRVWRDHRGMTLEQLGAKANLSIGYLSEIEAGKKPGSIKALRALAGALDLDLDDLTGWLR
jgi:hypothetical protein